MTTHPYYNVTLHVSVTDVGELYAAAHAHAVEQGMDARDVREACGTKRKPNIPGCLRTLLDPGIAYTPAGFEIKDSKVD